MPVQLAEGEPEIRINVVQQQDDDKPTTVVSAKPSLKNFNALRPAFIVSFLSIVLIGIFVGLNTTILTTSIPHLTEVYGDYQLSSWIITAYLLATLISIPVTGHLSEMMGRKNLMMLSIFVFTLGSLLCSTSWNLRSLIAFRTIQGLGSGPIHSLSAIIIHDLLPLHVIGRFVGIMAIIPGIAVIGGPAFGGLVAEKGNWRVVFYIDIAVGILSLSLIYFFLKYEEEREKVALEMEEAAVQQVVIQGGKKQTEKVQTEKGEERVPTDRIETNERRSKRRIASRIDYLGITLVMISIVLCLVSSSLASDSTLQWSHPAVISMFTIGAISFVLFLIVETKVSEEPAVPVLLLVKKPLLLLILLARFFEFFILVAVVSFLPHWYSLVIGDSPALSGARLLPIMFSFILASIFSGLLLSSYRMAWPFPVLGLAITSVGVGLMTMIAEDRPYGLIAFYLALLGVGLGATHQALTVLLVTPVDRDHHPNLLSAQQFMQNAGSVIGVQCFQVALRIAVGDTVEGDINKMDRESAMEMNPTDRDHLFQVYSFGMRILFFILVPVALVSFLMVLPLFRISVVEKRNRAQQSALPVSE